MKDFEDLDWKEVAVKGRSKREIYRYLALKGKYYLPQESQANAIYINDVMNGKKRVNVIINIMCLSFLKQKNVIIAHVPYMD